jgi:hypothetical protein
MSSRWVMRLIGSRAGRWALAIAVALAMEALAFGRR